MEDSLNGSKARLALDGNLLPSCMDVFSEEYNAKRQAMLERMVEFNRRFVFAFSLKRPLQYENIDEIADTVKGFMYWLRRSVLRVLAMKRCIRAWHNMKLHIARYNKHRRGLIDIVVHFWSQELERKREKLKASILKSSGKETDSRLLAKFVELQELPVEVQNRVVTEIYLKKRAVYSKLEKQHLEKICRLRKQHYLLKAQLEIAQVAAGAANARASARHSSKVEGSPKAANDRLAELTRLRASVRAEALAEMEIAPWFDFSPRTVTFDVLMKAFKEMVAQNRFTHALNRETGEVTLTPRISPRFSSSAAELESGSSSSPSHSHMESSLTVAKSTFLLPVPVSKAPFGRIPSSIFEDLSPCISIIADDSETNNASGSLEVPSSEKSFSSFTKVESSGEINSSSISLSLPTGMVTELNSSVSSNSTLLIPKLMTQTLQPMQHSGGCTLSSRKTSPGRNSSVAFLIPIASLTTTSSTIGITTTTASASPVSIMRTAHLTRFPIPFTQSLPCLSDSDLGASEVRNASSVGASMDTLAPEDSILIKAGVDSTQAGQAAFFSNSSLGSAHEVGSQANSGALADLSARIASEKLIRIGDSHFKKLPSLPKHISQEVLGSSSNHGSPHSVNSSPHSNSSQLLDSPDRLQRGPARGGRSDSLIPDSGGRGRRLSSLSPARMQALAGSKSSPVHGSGGSAHSSPGRNPASIIMGTVVQASSSGSGSSSPLPPYTRNQDVASPHKIRQVSSEIRLNPIIGPTSPARQQQILASSSSVGNLGSVGGAVKVRQPFLPNAGSFGAGRASRRLLDPIGSSSSSSSTQGSSKTSVSISQSFPLPY